MWHDPTDYDWQEHRCTWWDCIVEWCFLGTLLAPLLLVSFLFD